MSDDPKKSKDLTPVVGAETDARLGRHGATAEHECKADEDPDTVDWDRLAATEEFKALMAAKFRFILPATVFFILYYFALPILVGYAPEFMKTEVLGAVNIAYLFALSQFFMAWVIAALYVRAAGRYDVMARSIAEKPVRRQEKA